MQDNTIVCDDYDYQGNYSRRVKPGEDGCTFTNMLGKFIIDLLRSIGGGDLDGLRDDERATLWSQGTGVRG